MTPWVGWALLVLLVIVVGVVAGIILGEAIRRREQQIPHQPRHYADGWMPWQDRDE